jgi:hypothetical protein
MFYEWLWLVVILVLFFLDLMWMFLIWVLTLEMFGLIFTSPKKTIPKSQQATAIHKTSAPKSKSSSKEAKTNSSSEEMIGCSEPSKTYGVSEIDDFLGTSFEICVTLQDAQNLLTNVNDFLDDPTAYIAKKRRSS